jgi:hypothetical protein
VITIAFSETPAVAILRGAFPNLKSHLRVDLIGAEFRGRRDLAKALRLVIELINGVILMLPPNPRSDKRSPVGAWVAELINNINGLRSIIGLRVDHARPTHSSLRSDARIAPRAESTAD